MCCFTVHLLSFGLSCMRILYIGYSDQSTTSYHRFSALKRLGHDVTILDPYAYLSPILTNLLLGKLHYYTGYQFVQEKIHKWLKQNIGSSTSYELVWVDNGELLGPPNILLLKKLICPVILYNIDDPTGTRDGNRFISLKKSLPLYDLSVVVREATYQDFLRQNLTTFKVTMSYDEIAHKPDFPAHYIPDKFKSDIVFIGTWMRGEQRDKFILSLIDAGLSISIWGNRWEKSKYWNQIRPYFKGKNLKGREYVQAIQGAKISLGLLSKGNRDLHTTRSFEIPYAGGLLCAQRTSEHLKFFKETSEAVFWSSENECISVCQWLLNNEAIRQTIQHQGALKVKTLRVGNEDICEQILAEVNKISK